MGQASYLFSYNLINVWRICMNETSLLINSAFALRQQDLKPVYTQIGDKIDRPYTDSEIKNSIEQLIKLDNKAGKPQDEIDKRCFEFEKYLKEHTKKTDGKTNYSIDLNKLERIIITPKATGYISTAFIDFAKSNNIAIYWIDVKGKVDASFIPFNFKKPQLVVKQAEARLNGKSLKIAKYLIKLKLESEDMKEYIPKLKKAKDIKEVMQIEALASNLYFKNWEFSKEWNWKGRHGKASGNKNSIDQINTLLNLGYSLLAQRMSEILLKRGFELSIAFVHANEGTNYFNMLSYDILEPFRVWIDRQVIAMTGRHRINPDDFIFTDDKNTMVFKDDAFDIALTEFLWILEPLEHKSLSMIKEIEQILS
jgi:CRISPR-associated endonuclease Cas1